MRDIPTIWEFLERRWSFKPRDVKKLLRLILLDGSYERFLEAYTNWCDCMFGYTQPRLVSMRKCQYHFVHRAIMEEWLDYTFESSAQEIDGIYKKMVRKVKSYVPKDFKGKCRVIVKDGMEITEIYFPCHYSRKDIRDLAEKIQIEFVRHLEFYKVVFLTPMKNRIGVTKITKREKPNDWEDYLD